MARYETFYDPQLHPRGWSDPPEDHPWLVEARRVHEGLPGDADLAVEVEAAWVLASRVARAVTDHLEVSAETAAPPSRLVDLALLHVDARISRFPNSLTTISPRRTLEALAEELPWIDEIRRSDAPETVLARSPLQDRWGRSRLLFNVLNHAFQLIAAMAPKRPPYRDMPASATASLQDRLVETLVEHDADTLMHRAIDMCEQVLPGAWDGFRSLSYGAEASDRADRVVRVAAQEPPRSPLRGIIFVLSNPTYEGYTTADLSFSGAMTLDAEDWTDSNGLFP